jgi:hypothetical protein
VRPRFVGTKDAFMHLPSSLLTLSLSLGFLFAGHRLAYASSAAPAALASMIRCHETLNERSDGNSQKMDLEAPTPFAFQKAAKYYFVTDASISVLESKSIPQPKPGKEPRLFVVSLSERQVPRSYEIEIRDHGELGSVCCGDGAGKNLPALEPHAQLDSQSLAALKAELHHRLGTVTDSYQNKDRAMKTAEALQNCLGIDFGKKDYVEKLIEKIKRSAGNKTGNYDSSGAR